jgi:rare lipoprotein A (peptidoglycan hydrolase)
VFITNTANGKSVTVLVADECPTCNNAESIDLSTGAFNQIGDESTGLLSIEWKFV